MIITSFDKLLDSALSTSIQNQKAGRSFKEGKFQKIKSQLARKLPALQKLPHKSVFNVVVLGETDILFDRDNYNVLFLASVCRMSGLQDMNDSLKSADIIVVSSCHGQKFPPALNDTYLFYDRLIASVKNLRKFRPGAMIAWEKPSFPVNFPYASASGRDISFLAGVTLIDGNFGPKLDYLISVVKDTILLNQFIVLRHLVHDHLVPVWDCQALVWAGKCQTSSSASKTFGVSSCNCLFDFQMIQELQFHATSVATGDDDGVGLTQHGTTSPSLYSKCWQVLVSRKFDSFCLPQPSILINARTPLSRGRHSVQDLLITGMGGAGTHSTTVYLRSMGISMQHESISVSADHVFRGSVSWMYAANDVIAGVPYAHKAMIALRGAGESQHSSTYTSFLSPRFRRVVHQVRQPWKQISTITGHTSASYRFASRILLSTFAPRYVQMYCQDDAQNPKCSFAKYLYGVLKMYSFKTDESACRFGGLVPELKEFVCACRRKQRGNKCNILFAAVVWLLWSKFVQLQSDATVKVEDLLNASCTALYPLGLTSMKRSVCATMNVDTLKSRLRDLPPNSGRTYRISEDFGGIQIYNKHQQHHELTEVDLLQLDGLASRNLSRAHFLLPLVQEVATLERLFGYNPVPG
jgi:hypothetical protein